MANIDFLKSKVRIHIRDAKISDTAIEDLIDTVLREIAMETRIFKKLFGFTVHTDIEQYNFRYIARMNEQVEEEPVSITFDAPTGGEIIDFIANGVFPEIETTKVLEIDKNQAQFIDLLDIFDEYGDSVMHKFEERGSSTYFLYDEEYRKVNDKNRYVFSGWVVPDVNALHDEDLSVILSTVIAGCKFYHYDGLHSKDDVQATNYDFMRWYQAKENLGNRFPQTVYSTKENTRWL